jgi:MFS superfamily sulfate permease-like transporter
MFMVVVFVTVTVTVLVAVLVGTMTARRRTEMIRRVARVQRCVHRHSLRAGAGAARTSTGGGGQSARRGLGLDLNGESGDADALRRVAEQRRDRVQNALRIGRGEHCAKQQARVVNGKVP